MTIGWRENGHWLCTVLAAAGLALALGIGAAAARAEEDDDQGPCTRTAKAQYDACLNEVRDDFFTARAVCTNVSDPAERAECTSEAQSERNDANTLCREQLDAREDTCDLLGEDRYDPDFDPADFTTNFNNRNPYFPLKVGNRWTYEEGEETVEVEVLDKTKLIEGVTCIVVNDRVEEDGEPVEDTDDWFGQRKDGTVDYCGEISMNFEVFEGDDPEEAELVDVEGSWKTGRDGARPGTLFQGAPQAGASYRQEFFPGGAEDLATVLSTSYRYGTRPKLDQLVPAALAQALCSAGDCVVTREFTPIDPGVFEHKYYARGVGFFLSVNPGEGSVTRLVECNVGPKCALVP